MGIYGQLPGGGFAGDENCRPGYVDPRQGFETCGIVEFMHSFEMLTKISGNPLGADRCEEITFNSQASRAIYESVYEAVHAGQTTTDLGGRLSTTEFTNEVIGRVGAKLEVWKGLRR